MAKATLMAYNQKYTYIYTDALTKGLNKLWTAIGFNS